MRALAVLVVTLLSASFALAAPKDKKPKLDPKLAYLEIVCEAPGAKVSIDGTELANKTPLPEPIIVEPGKHSVKVQKLGYTEYADVVVAVAGKVVAVNADLIAVQGYLRFSINNLPEGVKAKVYIDGQYVGEVPYEGEIKSGNHVVEARSFEYFDFRKEVQVVPGNEYPFDVTLEKLPDALNPRVTKGPGARPGFFDSPVRIALAGAGGAGTIVLGVLGGIVLRNANQGCLGGGALQVPACSDSFNAEVRP